MRAKSDVAKGMAVLFKGVIEAERAKNILEKAERVEEQTEQKVRSIFGK